MRATLSIVQAVVHAGAVACIAIIFHSHSVIRVPVCCACVQLRPATDGESMSFSALARLSMVDIMLHKHIPGMLAFATELAADIRATRQ